MRRQELVCSYSLYWSADLFAHIGVCYYGNWGSYEVPVLKSVPWKLGFITNEYTFFLILYTYFPLKVIDWMCFTHNRLLSYYVSQWGFKVCFTLLSVWFYFGRWYLYLGVALDISRTFRCYRMYMEILVKRPFNKLRLRK